MRSTRKRKRISSGSVAASIQVQDEDGDSQLGNDKEAEVWDAFREEYVESVEQLPLSLHRNFALLKELDTQSNTFDSVLPLKMREYIRNRQEIRQSEANGASHVKVPQITRRSSARSSALRAANQQATEVQVCSETLRDLRLLSEISTIMNDLVRTAEEKVNLAQAAYDSVDRHVRLLDQAIKEHELHWKGDLSTVKINSPTFPIGGLLMTRMKDNYDSPDVASRPGTQKGSEKKSRSHSGARSRKSARKRSSSIAEPAVLDALNGGDQIVGKTKGESTLYETTCAIPTLSTDVSVVNAETATLHSTADMPIDPNEPRYCYCGQVSWGEMIACDAVGCEREWFHLGCVGLTEAPKRGKWYCDVCKESNPSGIRRRGH